MERWEILLTELHQRARVNPLVWAPLVRELWARFEFDLRNELRDLAGPEFYRRVLVARRAAG